MSENETKEVWIEKYAKRIFELWQNWQGPLGVSSEHMGHLKEELSHQYDDQLKRSMVELNYPSNCQR